MPLLCIVKEPWFHFVVPVIVFTIPLKFKTYCAFIVSSKRGFFNLLCLLLCLLYHQNSKFIVSSKRGFFEFIVPVIVPPLASKFEFYCAYIVSSK